VTYIGELLGNPVGGVKQSAIYEDQKLAGLNGLAFHANMFQIDGGGLFPGSAVQFDGRQRHRSVTDHAALRNVVGVKMEW
jgi:hypothetical protein